MKSLGRKPSSKPPQRSSQLDLPVGGREHQLSLDFEALREPEQAHDPASVPMAKDPVHRLAERFAELLAAEPERHVDNRDLNALARETLGAAAGHARDAYDAAEAGLNLYLGRLGLDFLAPDAVLDRLLGETERMPLQNRRDRRQVELQQFSTPPATAFLIAHAAALRPGMTVLEPSAGTGNLASFARLLGGEVHTNEIDPRRASLLRLLGFKPTAFDAERLDNLLPADLRYDAILMNPPFSATGGRVEGHSAAFGARHVEQALLRLKPGGRLVAILGAGMSLQAPNARGWWEEVFASYRVRANLTMEGISYLRFGATVDHQLIVIDHDGSTGNRGEIHWSVPGSVWHAYWSLREIAKEDVYGRIHERARERGKSDPRGEVWSAPDARRGPGPGAGNGTARRRVGGSAGHPELDADDRRMAPVEPAAACESAARSRDGERAAAGGGVSPAADGTSTAGLGSLAAPQHAGPALAGIGELHATEPPRSLALEEGAVFAAYRIQKARLVGAHAHPANVVESAAMACVEPPDVSYRHHLPAEVIAEGRVSDLQLEDLLYAGQVTSQLLPSSARRGHWNGDGTGIGKGRELYAFLYDQFSQGQRKHVHISASHQLVADAERDRSALGLPLKLIHQARLGPKAPVEADEGVFFTTYSMLATDFHGERPRFEQLVDWLGDDFEGVIAFDEAHLMKNAAAPPHGGKTTVDQGTLRGNMGIALQRQFPRARVRYFSATGATEARHLAPYERLGLWGAGAPFPDFAAFLVAIERGGVAAMEMLCRDLKGVGTYLSRTISYGPSLRPDGAVIPESAVEYEPILHRLSPEERQQYDRIADLWSELLVAFEAAESRSGEPPRGSRYSQFYATQQRFFLQLMMSYAAKDVLPAIQQDLEAGRSVVVSLFNTGEALTERKVRDARAEGLDLAEIDATPHEMMVALIEKQFPLYQYEERTDPVTKIVIRVRIEDGAGNPELNRENLRHQQELLDKAADLDFPEHPLDLILTTFGTGMVAEISGRTHRFEHGSYVRRKLSGVPHRELNDHETRLFQAGQKRIAVLTGAGSTGISVHAERSAANQARRVFYALQLSWSADLALVDVASQKRLVNAVSKRLAALGALTKGERHSLSSALFRPEDVTDGFGKAALVGLYKAIASGKFAAEGLGLAELRRMGVLDKDGSGVRESYLANVEQFLNRIMALPVSSQNLLFERFYERYLAAVEAAKRQGAFDFGVEEIRANNLREVTTPEILHVDQGSGARTLLHELAGEVEVLRNSFDFAAGNANLGFYRNLRSGRIYGAADHGSFAGSEVSLVGVKGPRRWLEAAELTEKYESVERAEARLWWDGEFERTPATEAKRFHVLSGAVFPIYDKIMGANGIRSVKIARAVLAEGQALVGLNLSPEDVPGVKLRLGIGTPLAEASAAEILELLASGALIELDNGWRLAKARISSDEVLELTLNGVPGSRDELLGYGFLEEIVRFKRRWFVLPEGAAVVLPRLLARRKPVRNGTAAGTAAYTTLA